MDENVTNIERASGRLPMGLLVGVTSEWGGPSERRLLLVGLRS
jgi:hypothetical protein